MDDGRWTLEKEIDRIFKENPELVGKSMKDIAKYFYIEGQLYKSNAAEASNQKLIHYKKHLTKDQLAQADKVWKESVG